MNLLLCRAWDHLFLLGIHIQTRLECAFFLLVVLTDVLPSCLPVLGFLVKHVELVGCGVFLITFGKLACSVQGRLAVLTRWFLLA